MDSLRWVSGDGVAADEPCSRCQASGCHWDRILHRAFCPDCEESLALGEGPPLVLRAERRRCVVCDRQGTVPFQTFPLHASGPVEMDLCGEHFRALLGRRLGPHAFHQLRRRLETLGLRAERVFLLHEVFYDNSGRALAPVADPE